MVKYINDVVNDFYNRKGGIEKNASLWEAMPTKVSDIDEDVKQLQELEKQIDQAVETAQQLRAKARLLVEAKKKRITKIDNLAYGLHDDDASQLLSYGISLKRSPSPKAIPSKGILKSIIDDYDGKGFILEREVISSANNYEWEKAQVDNPAVTYIDETQFVHFKVTNKKTFTDDEVKKGVRYFYRFRGFNASGHGAWSEPVSRVQ